MIGSTETNLTIGDNVTKPVENYEQLIQRFTKRTMQLVSRQDELKGWYEEYIKNENDLKRLEGSLQAINMLHMVKCLGTEITTSLKTIHPKHTKK